MVAEIERKYLVLNDSWRKNASTGSVLRQTYLLAKKNRFVRIRIVDDTHAFLAVKIRTGPTTREEFEYEIPYRDALQMADFATDVLEKIRYEVVDHGNRWEVDVYGGSHEGLVLAELELKSENDKFSRPPWLGAEVTGNAAYSNQTIAAFWSQGRTSFDRAAELRGSPYDSL